MGFDEFQVKGGPSLSLGWTPIVTAGSSGTPQAPEPVQSLERLDVIQFNVLATHDFHFPHIHSGRSQRRAISSV
jgi:hypothetical protein